VLHNGVLYDLIQGESQCHRGPNVAKMADFKVFPLCQYACNQKTNGELDTVRQYLNFFLARVLKFILVRFHVTFNVRVVQGVNQQSRMGIIYISFRYNCVAA